MKGIVTFFALLGTVTIIACSGASQQAPPPADARDENLSAEAGAEAEAEAEADEEEQIPTAVPTEKREGHVAPTR